MHKSQPHIAVFLRNLTGGGAERVMLNLAIGFAERGVRVDLILANADGKYITLIPEKIQLINFHNSDLNDKLRFATGFQSCRSLPKLINYL